MPRTHAAILANRGAIFGVTQYGFPVDSTALTIDPALLTDANCASIKAARDTENIGWTIDQETKEKIYLIADPCALDDVVTQSLAKIYDLDVAGASQ